MCVCVCVRDRQREREREHARERERESAREREGERGRERQRDIETERDIERERERERERKKERKRARVSAVMSLRDARRITLQAQIVQDIARTACSRGPGPFGLPADFGRVAHDGLMVLFQPLLLWPQRTSVASDRVRVEKTPNDSPYRATPTSDALQSFQTGGRRPRG